MYGSLFWIEWLDRLDRVLTATRSDVAALTRSASPRALEAIERSRRQLAALTHDLSLLDRDVLTAVDEPARDHRADRLREALDAAVVQLGNLSAELPAPAPISHRLLLAMDAALRDSSYEAAMLLAPARRQASALTSASTGSEQ
jgi:hypothetical protein